jgi:tetratricopeptide (TPR) repeat protein
MARIACTAIVVILLSVFVGCQGTESGSGQMVPTGAQGRYASTPVINIDETGETDLIEQMVVNRQAYQRGLEMLVAYYDKTGNNMKLQWARKELGAFHSMSKYNYIIEANIVQANAGPKASIPEADGLFYEAQAIKSKAGPLGPLEILKNENQLRLALSKFNELIRKHPTSDKVDDAAYEAGDIYEYLKDYSIAVLYFKQTFEWDPDTSYPARFRAAYVSEKYLHRNAEALQLYKEAVRTEGRHAKNRLWKDLAEKQILELQGSVDTAN